MIENHLFFRVQHIPEATIDWASNGMRAIAENDWGVSSSLIVHNAEGCWIIHGGVDDAAPTDYLGFLLDAAYDLLQYDSLVLKVIGKIFYEGGLRDQVGIYTVTPGSQIRISHAVCNITEDGVEGPWTHYTEEDINSNNRIELEIISILKNARTHLNEGR